MPRLKRRFFDRPSVDVARDLVGSLLVRVIRGQRVSGAITEVEAYGGTDDPASHAFRGPTARNRLMFGSPGVAYVYFIYGFHHCFNVTTESSGTPGAVLVRALSPIQGIEMMRRNRPGVPDEKLADGPGNLTKALGIDLKLNGEDLVGSRRLFLEEGQKVGVMTTPRIGVSRGKTRLWRFVASTERESL